MSHAFHDDQGGLATGDPGGAISDTGDLLILDMGEPVKVLDLAKRMAQLSGLTYADDPCTPQSERNRDRDHRTSSGRLYEANDRQQHRIAASQDLRRGHATHSDRDPDGIDQRPAASDRGQGYEGIATILTSKECYSPAGAISDPSGTKPPRGGRAASACRP